MQSTGVLPRQFEAVRDHDEHVLWTGKPARLPFVLRGVPFLMVGLVWGAIDLGADGRSDPGRAYRRGVATGS